MFFSAWLSFQRTLCWVSPSRRIVCCSFVNVCSCFWWYWGRLALREMKQTHTHKHIICILQILCVYIYIYILYIYIHSKGNLIVAHDSHDHCWANLESMWSSIDEKPLVGSNDYDNFTFSWHAEIGCAKQINEIPPSAILSSRQPSRPIDHWLVRYEVLGNECLLYGSYVDGCPDGHFARLWQQRRGRRRRLRVQQFDRRFLH